MKTYSMDLRERVVAAYDSKMGTQVEIAERFNVSVSWLKKLLRLRRDRGSFAPKPHGGDRAPKFHGKRLDELEQWVQEKQDATLQELLERSALSASVMAVHRALRLLGCRRKKSRCAPPNRIAPT